MAKKSKADSIAVTRGFLWETEALLLHMVEDLRHRSLADKARVEGHLDQVRSLLK